MVGDQIKGSGEALSQQRQRNRLASLLCLDDLHCHALTLSKRAYPRLLDYRDVNEDVLLTVLNDGEAEALIGAEPLHRAFHCGRSARVYTLALR